MRIDDFIMFGRTVPEKSQKYGVTVCGAGYSPEIRSFIRIYPLPIRCKIESRDMVTVEVDRSKHDSRHESWALKDRNEKSVSGSLGKMTKEEIRQILEKRVTTLDNLNDAKASLGVIKPDNFDVEMKTRAAIQDPNQMSLFDEFEETITFKTSSDYFKIPYLVTSEGKQKHLQLREWGIYELMRKNPTKINAEYVSNALHIGKDKDVFFIVGNMNQFKTVWLVIKVFSFDKKPAQLSMF